MIEERIYFREDLHHGVCKCCNEESDEIIGNDLCVDCVEEQRFIEETMEQKLKFL